MPLAFNFDDDVLVNEAERLVVTELEQQLSVLSETTVCHCRDCVIDMAALALNSVKPLYRSSLLGSIYTANAMDEKSYADSIRVAVAKAIKKVKQNPSHD